MSLFKQLLILVGLLFLVIFTINFALSMQNIRSYLQIESEVHVQDTATSLGLSLSPHMSDENDPILRTMMNAIFDTGYYQEMRLVNVDGEELVHLQNPEEIRGVPDWIRQVLPIETAEAVSEISTGWNIAGTLHVSSNPGYGYLKLYEQFKSTLMFTLLVLVLSVALLWLVLRLTLKPLREIEDQANQISAGHFVETPKMPVTLEVRNVARAMNSMSGKIGGMITRMNNKLDSLSDSLKRDSLTGLFNQETFNTEIKRALSAGEPGYAALLKFDDLAGFARERGNRSVDNLLVDFADILKQKSTAQISFYRLYGSEFAMIYPHASEAEIESLANALQHDLDQLGQMHGIEDLMHTGIVHFERSSEMERLMPAMVEAYEQARLIGQNAFHIKQDSLSSISEMDWKAAIEHAIDYNTPEITFTAEAYNYQTEPAQKVMREAFTQVRNDEGDVLSIGTFFSMAEEFALVESLDKTIIHKIISQLETADDTTPVTVNVSMASVSSTTFRQWLQTRLEETKLAPERLAFSVTAYAAAKNLQAFTSFSLFVRNLGARVLLKRYTPDVVDVDVLKDLHLDYLRLARDMTTDISSHASKPDFLNLIQEVSGLLDIKVLAESVTDEQDFAIVKQAGLYGISR